MYRPTVDAGLKPTIVPAAMPYVNAKPRVIYLSILAATARGARSARTSAARARGGAAPAESDAGRLPIAVLGPQQPSVVAAPPAFEDAEWAASFSTWRTARLLWTITTGFGNITLDATPTLVRHLCQPRPSTPPPESHA